MRRCATAAIWLILLVAADAHATGDRIWSALVLATKEDTPSRIPEALQESAPAIRKIFGYNSLYLLGEKRRNLYAGSDEWLVPTKEFFFRVRCLSQGSTSYILRIELYRDENLLVTTEAKLAKGAPLFIRGPEWGRGQLIFLLEVK
jgi:hypothetical protein